MIHQHDRYSYPGMSKDNKLKGIEEVNGKYRARVTKDNVQHRSQCFDSLVQAIRWYENKCEELYGESHIEQEALKHG